MIDVKYDKPGRETPEIRQENLRKKYAKFTKGLLKYFQADSNFGI